jgi:hypothetical protein
MQKPRRSPRLQLGVAREGGGGLRNLGRFVWERHDIYG